MPTPDVFPSIFIIGPMGAGKTTVGRLLAKQLDRDFVDSDWYIEEKTGADIAWIFNKEGEVGFRQRESRAIDALTQQESIVLATGGGVVVTPENRQRLRERGIVVYLRASVSVQLARTKKDNTRPLLQNANPRKVLEALFSIRDPLYQEIADITLTTGQHYPRQMVAKIIEEVARHHKTVSRILPEKIGNKPIP